MERAQGIDVSWWDGYVDYNKAFSNGASFMFAKASQWSADKRFSENWRNAKGILLRGAYHYFDFGWSEIGQAKLFVDTMNGDYGELPPMLDFEADPPPGMKADEVAGKVWNFLTYVEKATGRIPGIYTGYYTWRTWGNSNPGWERFPLWLPWWASPWWIFVCTKGGNGAPKPWKNWTFWQDTGKADGRAYGCQSLDVDHNWFNGTVDDLRLFAGASPLPTPPPVPAPSAGLYRVTAFSLKVFAGAGDTFKQIGSLSKNAVVTVLSTTTVRGEKWANIESPAGWCRLSWLTEL